MTHPTFKLYRKPPLAASSQDKRRADAGEYIGHVIVEGKTYGLLAHTVTEGKGKDVRRHFEGRVIDWQTLIREHVAKPTPEPGENLDLVQQAESMPFDDVDKLKGIA